MLKPAERSITDILKRIGLWFVCLLLGDALFSLLLWLWLSMGGGSFGPRAIITIFRISMTLALPVWCLCLPVVIAVKNIAGWSGQFLLGGTLIGPLSMALWSLILQLRGVDHQIIWHGDPLVGEIGGGIAGMIFALIVGLLTSSFYLVGVRILQRRSTAADRRSAQV